jgi:hypothetical protein
MPTSRIKELAWQPKVRDVLSFLFYGFGTAAPADGEGAGTASKGSLFVDYIGGNVYYNAGSRTSPTWLVLGGGASAGVKYLDDVSLFFGDGTSEGDESVGDVTLLFDSTDQRLELTATRPAATSPAYAYGLVLDGDALFVGTGAGVKQFGLYLTGGRPDTAVMGGDSHDMQLKIDYANEAVNTPAGSYARGLSVQMNNSSAGAITSLQGGFIGVRQRSTAAANTIRGLQIDTKVDSSKLAPDTAIEGLRVEMNVCANAPASSYGVVVRNLTDGVYTLPTAAFKAYNDGTSSCKGFSYGLDLMSSLAIASGKTVDLGDIRFSQKDANELPCCLFTGTGTSDGTIVSDVGADSLWADGSLYISVVDGAGTLWQKVNDTWTQIS